MAKQIILTSGEICLVSNEDYDYLSQFKWSLCGQYVMGRVFGKLVYLHRLILGLSENSIEECDHLSGCTLDNRRENLKICNRSENLINRSKFKNCSSKYKWVSRLPSGKYRAQIGKEYLGCFESQEEAAIVANERALEKYGELTKINFI